MEIKVMKVFDPDRMEWFIGKVWVENGKVFIERV